MADYVRITLVNGDTRHLPVSADSRGAGMVDKALGDAFGQVTVRTAEGTLVVAQHIVEAEPALDQEDIDARPDSEYL